MRCAAHRSPARARDRRPLRRTKSDGILRLQGGVARMTGLLADPVSKEHETPPGHPERPARFDAVVDGLRRAGMLDQLLRIDSRSATDDEVGLCHAPEYIRLANREIRGGIRMLST